MSNKEKVEAFIVDCPICKAKVAAIEKGLAERRGYVGDPGMGGEPYGDRVHVGNCPKCDSILVGACRQISFETFDSDYDEWSEIERVYPNPPKIFISSRIPKNVTESLLEADRSIQANANTAACAMLGRAMEGIFRHMLQVNEPNPAKISKRIMLDQGIKQLEKKGLIEKRFVDWSQHLRAFRNIAAHPGDDSPITREEAQDLQTFVYAMTDYIYDLADRYEEFQDRLAFREKRKKKTSEKP